MRPEQTMKEFSPQNSLGKITSINVGTIEYQLGSSGKTAKLVFDKNVVTFGSEFNNHDKISHQSNS